MGNSPFRIREDIKIHRTCHIICKIREGSRWGVLALIIIIGRHSRPRLLNRIFHSIISRCKIREDCLPSHLIWFKHHFSNNSKCHFSKAFWKHKLIIFWISISQGVLKTSTLYYQPLTIFEHFVILSLQFLFY